MDNSLNKVEYAYPSAPMQSTSVENTLSAMTNAAFYNSSTTATEIEPPSYPLTSQQTEMTSYKVSSPFVDTSQFISSVNREKAYSVCYDGVDVDIYRDDILYTVSIDKNIWNKYQRGAARTHPFRKGCQMSEVLCVVPWVIHQIVFAPCLWCLPLIYTLSCSPYGEKEIPEFAEDALVFTKYGVHSFDPEGSTTQRIGIKWENVDKANINIVKGKQMSDLHCKVGVGCLSPCWIYNCGCFADVDDVYSVSVSSSFTSTSFEVAGLGVNDETILDKVEEYKYQRWFG